MKSPRILQKSIEEFLGPQPCFDPSRYNSKWIKPDYRPLSVHRLSNLPP